MRLIVLLLLFTFVSFIKTSAQNIDSVSVAESIEQAKQLESEREFTKAREILLPLILKTKENNLLPQYAELMLQAGKNYFRSFELDSAIYWLEQLLQEDAIYNFPNYKVIYSSFTYLGESYSRLKIIDKCIASFKQSIDYAKKVEAANLENDVFLARAYHNTGVALEEVGDLESSLIYMDSALYNLRETLQEPSELEALIYSNKGNVYKKRGFFEKAIVLNEQHIELYKVLPKESITPRDWGLAYWYLGSVYQFRNASEEDHLKALEYTKISEDYFLSISPDYPLMTYVYYQYAEGYLRLNETEKSLYYIELAEKRNKELYGDEFGELGYCYLIKAKIAERNNDLVQALAFLEDELNLYEKINWSNINDVAEGWYVKGNILLASSKNEAALEAHQKALKILIPDFIPENTELGLLENPLPQQLFNNSFLFNALQYKAKSLMAIFESTQQKIYLEKAVECYELAYNYISLSREEVVNLKTKAAFSRNQFSIYEQGIAAAFNAYQRTQDDKYLVKAANFADMSKSNNLLDKLQKSQQEKRLSIPAELLENERKMLSLVSFTEKQLYEQKRNKADSSEIAKLEKQLFEYQLDYEVAVEQIREGYPAYYHFNKESKIDITSLMGSIPENHLFLSYFSGEEHTYVFSIGKDFIAGYELDPVSEYSESVEELIQAIQTKQDGAYAKLAWQLYQTLLEKPLTGSEALAINKITLLPDASISYLPFDLLITEMPTDVTNLKNYAYLIKDYEMSYHYSLNLINFTQSLNTEPAVKDVSFLGFAPGFDQLENPLLATRSAKDRDLASSLGSLPGALEEVQMIAQFMDGKFMVGDKATESAFKQQATQADFLHLATHTIIDDENPLYSKLIFSQSESENEDGLLYTYELFNMDLNAQMVSLSACNTATGKYYKGEGMVSLGSGFMYAGVPNVMMTSWAVSDATTSTIMQQFYKELKNGETKATALRNAKLEYLDQADENLAHPYYWGAYMIIGNTIEPENNRVALIVGSCLLLGVVVGFRIIKRKNS